MLRINYDDLEEADEWGSYAWEGKPFTCIAYELYPNGQLSCEVEFIYGIESGSVRKWYPSGKLKFDGYGKIDESRSWGNEWFENGGLKSEAFYESGIRVKEKIWDEEGQLISQYERPAQKQPPLKRKLRIQSFLHALRIGWGRK